MFNVYILYSHKDRQLYVGQTNDLEQRLTRHNNGHVGATKYRRPLTCIHNESFDTRTEAMAREKFLKSLWSARFKNKLKNEFESGLNS
jgi:putative endonuclease